jgi:hypothetical protein
MKRNSRIPVQVTPNEKEMIQASASSMDTNSSRLLRLLGLKAKGIYQFIPLIRQLTARLLRIKSLSRQRPVPPEELQSVVDGALERVQSVEEALQVPPDPDHSQ